MNPQDKPTAAQRTALTQRLVAMGYRGQDLAAIIVAGRTRAELSQALIVLARQAQKAP